MVPVSGYDVMLGQGTAGPFGTACSAPPGNTSCVSTVAVASSATYTWFVRANVVGCTAPGGDSPRFTFTTTGGGCSPPAITPSSLPNATQGSSYSASFTATGGTAPYSFGLSAGSLPPGLSLAPAGTLAGTPTTPGSFTFDVRVIDGAGCSTVRSYTLIVSATPACGAITIVPETLPNATQNSPYNVSLAATGGTPPFTFTVSAGVLPPGLTLTSAGNITGSPTTSGSTTFSVRAVDNAGCSTLKNYTLVVDPVTCPAITITPASLPNAPVNAAYSVTFSAAGGVGPYTFTTFAGALPSGLTLSTSGILSGTPTTPGSFTFDVRAADSSGCATIRNFTLVVGSTTTCPAITIFPATLADATQNSPYNAALGASGGTPPYSFSLTSGVLPPGLTVASGGITGTPTVTGTFAFDIRVVDAANCTDVKSFTLVVRGSTTCPAIVIAPDSLPNGTLNLSYSTSMTATGGTPPYTFNVANGTLPSGLTLAPSGFLSGTPGVSGTFTFEVRVSDSAGCSVAKSYTLVVGTTGTCPAMSVLPASVPNAIQNSPYTITLGATGGTPPYTFRVVTGLLPPGLTLTSAGGISGTLTVTGTFVFEIMATDSAGCTATRSYTLVADPQTPGCPTAPSQPTIPAPNSIVAPGDVLFSWTPVTGATGYDLYAGTNGAAPVRIAKTTTNFATVALTAGLTVEWYVVAFVPNCNPLESPRARFNTLGGGGCPQTAPAIVSPLPAAVVPVGPVTLQWTAVLDARTYEVFAGLNGRQPVSIGSTAGTTVLTTTIGEIAEVEWFVRAGAPGCTAVDSAHARFRTTGTCANPSPTLMLPVNGTTGPLPVTFVWSPVAGAVGYKLFGGSGPATVPTLIGSTATTTQFTAASLPTGTIEWFVQALFDGCPPVESTRNTFTVSGGGATCPATTAPVLIAPANGASNVPSPVTFSWAGVPASIGYRLLVALNGGAPAPITITPGTQFTAEFPAGVTVDWAVEATFAECPARQSTTYRFTTVQAATCPPIVQAPVLIAPQNGAANQVSPVTFQWSGVPQAIQYRVSASVNGAAPVVLATTTTTQLTAEVPQGTISWAVEAVFRDCPSTVSTRSTFTVSTGTLCHNTPVSLVTPVNNATGVRSPVEFRWTPAPGASLYRLFASLNGTTFDLLGTANDATMTRIMPPGTYQWFVETEFVGCPAQRSSTFVFTVGGETSCPAASLTLIAPVNGSSPVSPVTFSWTPTAGASEYRLWLSVDGGSPATIARTSATTATAPVPSGTIEWSVEALFASCPSVLSARGTFSVQRLNTCDQNQPATLLSPIATPGGPPEVSGAVAFNWSPVPGASGYRVWVAVAGQPFGDIGATTETHLTRELPPGAYEWFIDTAFAGCPSRSSQRSAFAVIDAGPRCANNTPSILAPGEGANSVSSPVTFLWSSAPDAVEYRLFASLDGGEFSLIGATTDTSLIRTVPPGTVLWFVEAAFKGCPSTRSARSRFTVPQAVTCGADRPELFAPANGAADVTQPVTFAWSAVSNAIEYHVAARAGDGAPTTLAITNGTLAAASLPPGTIEWWVAAFFPSCPSTESSHAFFTVPAVCDTRRPILITPASASAISSPVFFSWTPVPGATEFKLRLSVDNAPPALFASVQGTSVSLPVPSGTVRATVEAMVEGCPPAVSPESEFAVSTPAALCVPPEKPVANVIGQSLSATSYGVRWTPLLGITLFELQESTTLDFVRAATQTIQGVTATFTHTAETPVPYYYRVRGVSSCSDERGPYSEVIAVLIVPPARTQASTEIGASTDLVQTVFIPGSTTPVPFTATPDKPWLTVTPSSGTIGPDGVTLTIKPDPAALVLGTNTGTVNLTYSVAGKWVSPNGTTPPSTVPISVSLVTPVAPGGKNTPTPDSLIIPAVAHAPGANNSLFQSDVRVTNISAQTIKYLVNFTPSGTDGTVSGKSTTIQIEPGATTALDDVLTSFFGTGESSGAAGVVEVRPVTGSSTTTSLSTSRPPPRTTVASSRTYNVTPSGTFGQFIPAIPFSQFLAKASGSAKSVLSLQQIAQSSAYRTNFGLVEGSGEPVDVMVSIFSNANDLLKQIPITLRPGEHRQLNSFLAANDIAVEDGRIEVEVTSSTGKVTAYASVVNNATNDPLVVFPVLKGSRSASRYVLPGAAYIQNDVADWRTDIRVFNASATSTAATLTFYPQGTPGAPLATDLVLAAGEVRAIDNVLTTLLNAPSGSGGSIVITTPSSTSLIVTARTYNQTATGTYGQFVPGVTPEESVGRGDRALQILQVEHSARYRTNIGVAETTGNAADVEVAVLLPDSKASPKVTIPLAANEFRQISLGQFGLGNVYNARVTVKVTSGTGKVTAYGSVIDMQTQDPTYVPAQ